MPAQMSTPKMPSDVFAASFDCFFVQAQPGQLTLFRVTLPDGQMVDCRLDPNSLMTLSRMAECAVHAMMAPPAQIASPAQPPAKTDQPENAAQIKDSGTIEAPVSAKEDAGDVAPITPTIN